MSNTKNKSTFQIMCMMFLCIIMPFSHASFTIDPVLHLRFTLWATFLFIALIMIFQKKNIFLSELFVIQKYHLLLVFFAFISFSSIFISTNNSEAIFDFLGARDDLTVWLLITTHLLMITIDL